jgi:WD repeat-containing protein mio
MVVNSNGDLELYAVHDTPKQTPWSSRGDLAIGIGQSYKIISGFHDSEPPAAPWDIPALPNAQPPESISPSDQTREESVVRGRPKHASFGRGDEDGFPALVSTAVKTSTNLAATKPGKSRTYSPASFRKYHIEPSTERQTVDKDLPSQDGAVDQLAHAGGDSSSQARSYRSQRDKSASRGRRQPIKIIHQVVEDDISMIMRTRAIRGYGLSNVQFLSYLCKGYIDNYFIASTQYAYYPELCIS